MISFWPGENKCAFVYILYIIAERIRLTTRATMTRLKFLIRFNKFCLDTSGKKGKEKRNAFGYDDGDRHVIVVTIFYIVNINRQDVFFFFLLLFDYDCSEFRYSGDLIRIFNFSNSENRIYTWITDFELMANLRVFTSPVNAKYYSIISAGWPTRFLRICQFYRTNIMYPKNSIFVISYTK